jgi:hypothetical protein
VFSLYYWFFKIFGAHPLISTYVKKLTFRNPNELALLAKQTYFWITKSCATMTWAFYVAIVSS